MRIEELKIFEGKDIRVVFDDELQEWYFSYQPDETVRLEVLMDNETRVLTYYNLDTKEYNNRFHDRFLILDDSLYHFGASFKDLGKRLFAFELMGSTRTSY